MNVLTDYTNPGSLTFGISSWVADSLHVCPHTINIGINLQFGPFSESFKSPSCTAIDVYGPFKKIETLQ